MISVIIPVYNESNVLSKNSDYFSDLSSSVELIFVDGGSSDNTCEQAKHYGKLVMSAKGRSGQMNAGAKVAQGDILLFLHADTILYPNYLDRIEHMVKNCAYVGGCFSQVFDQPGLIFKWIAWTGNVRAKISKIFYGDQGIFVRRDIFWELDGFPQAKMCEDVLLTKKLKSYGKVGILSYPIHCSARRWIRQGIIRTFFINTRINMALAFRFDLDKLAKTYLDIRES